MKSPVISRRKFLGSLGKATAGLTLLSPGLGINAIRQSKTRIAIVGTGMRSLDRWGKDLLAGQGDVIELVGLCDINPLRVEMGKKMLAVNVPTFTNFKQMIRDCKPDRVIVATVDTAHPEQIIQGMALGCDMITEAPMTIDEKKCQAILDTEKKTGQNVTVPFSYRYSPHRQRIKEILHAGEIGAVVSVDFHWYLDLHHGADFFRGWQRLRDQSGSLLVHQSNHHFDLMNWWLEADPVEVFAYGKLDHYGSNGKFRSRRCLDCPYTQKCQFFWDITQNTVHRELYLTCEKADGYLRDGCVFRDDIDIWDTMAVQVKYSNDVHMSYSLNAFMPYEGYRIVFNGTKGRLEAWIYEHQPWQTQNHDEIRLTKDFGSTRLIVVPRNRNRHKAAENRLRNMIFNPEQPDPDKQLAGSRDGAMSILPGIAARMSIDEKMPIQIKDLITI